VYALIGAGDKGCHPCGHVPARAHQRMQFGFDRKGSDAAQYQGNDKKEYSEPYAEQQILLHTLINAN